MKEAATITKKAFKVIMLIICLSTTTVVYANENEKVGAQVQIENYIDLKLQMEEAQAKFSTQTDSVETKVQELETYSTEKLAKLEEKISDLNMEDLGKLTKSESEEMIDSVKIILEDIPTVTAPIRKEIKELKEEAESLGELVKVLQDFTDYLFKIHISRGDKDWVPLFEYLKEETDNDWKNEEQEIEKVLNVSEALLERCSLLDKRKKKIEKQIAEFEEMRESLREKLDEVWVSEDADMSDVYGFTEEELKYLLINYENVAGDKIPTSIIDALSSEIPKLVKEYPCSELTLIAVMLHESGVFTSDMARNKNNYSGLMKKGKGRYYETKEQGIKASVVSFYHNMKGGNTLYDINSTYCEWDEDGKYAWTPKVLSHLKDLVYTEV